MVKRIGLRQVPWESWAHWVWVADEIFSGCNDRVTAAQNRIKAWQGRGLVPISVETTSVLTAIQQRDPYFNTELAPGDVLCDDMLGMMYAMAIQRLVNGVVDVSAKRNTTSVASRADWAGLPRLLVDIRHETAHNDLPGLPLLRSASKQALEWLKAHYWESQRKALGKVREKLKVKLLEHCQLVVDILTPMLTTNDEGKDEDVDTEGKTRRVKVMRSMRNIHKRNLKAMKQERATVFQDLECLCLISTSELVSILVDDGLLEQGVLDGPEGRDNALLESGDSDLDTSSFDLEAATYTAWRYTICRLSSQLPRLPAMLLVAIVKRIGRPISGSNACTISRTGSVMPSLLSSERPDSPKKTENGRSSSTGLNLLIAWCGWLLESEYSEAAVESISQEAVKSQILGISWKINVKAGLTEELCRELMRSCLHLSLEREPLEQLVSWIALKIGSKKLQQQALMLSKFGSISQRTTVSNDKSGGSKERDSVIGSVASMQEVTTHGSLSGEAQKPSESCPDSSRKSHSITRTCDLDDSVYKMVKKQQHEVLARAASEGSGVGRGCVRGEEKDEFGPVTGGQAKGQLAGNRTPGLQGRRWTVAENWTPCAIGMIPSPYSVVGIIPPLDLSETGDTLEDMVTQRVTGNTTINSVETTTVRKRKGDVDRSSPTSEQRAKEAGHHVHFRVLEKISENLQQFDVDADEHVDTLEDTVTGNATINSVETTTVTKRKGDVDQSSLSSEKRAKKDGHHVQFRGPEKMSENVHESRYVKELNGRKALDSKLVRHPGGTLLEGCLRQEDQQVLHVSPQQLEQLKAAIHTVA